MAIDYHSDGHVLILVPTCLAIDGAALIGRSFLAASA
jgi:hypothetical protein